jgi:hypothetical protein
VQVGEPTNFPLLSALAWGHYDQCQAIRSFPLGTNQPVIDGDCPKPQLCRSAVELRRDRLAACLTNKTGRRPARKAGSPWRGQNVGLGLALVFRIGVAAIAGAVSPARTDPTT